MLAKRGEAAATMVGRRGSPASHRRKTGKDCLATAPRTAARGTGRATATGWGVSAEDDRRGGEVKGRRRGGGQQARCPRACAQRGGRESSGWVVAAGEQRARGGSGEKGEASDGQGERGVKTAKTWSARASFVVRRRKQGLASLDGRSSGGQSERTSACKGALFPNFVWRPVSCRPVSPCNPPDSCQYTDRCCRAGEDFWLSPHFCARNVATPRQVRVGRSYARRTVGVETVLHVSVHSMRRTRPAVAQRAGHPPQSAGEGASAVTIP